MINRNDFEYVTDSGCLSVKVHIKDKEEEEQRKRAGASTLTASQSQTKTWSTWSNHDVFTTISTIF